MPANYWTRVTGQRLSRRRALYATGGTALGALLAAACGSDAEPGTNGQTGTTVTGVATQPADTTSQAIRGGIMQGYLTSESDTFDPLMGTVQAHAHATHAYSQLVKSKLGTFDSLSDGTVEPDAALSHEFSPDGLQLTFNLRPGMKLDPREPTNGRELTMDDVKYSWDVFAETNPSRGNWLTSIVPDAPVDSVEFPDATTMVVNLSFPMASLVRWFAIPEGTTFYIVPTEADGQFDNRQEMRGSGPFMLTRYVPSQGWEYRSNPNWYRADEAPLLDGIDYALMSEPTVRLSQFRARRLWYLTPEAEDIASLTSEFEDVLAVPFNPLGSGANGDYTLTLSKLEDSPLRDVRIRHAISLLIDREPWIDTFYNISGLEAIGLPMESAWNSHFCCTATEWLDPQSNQLGEDSRWFHHNPEEAARLLEAADAFGLEQDFSYATSGLTTPATSRRMEVFAQMLQEGGHFKLRVNTGDYTSWFQPEYFRARAQYDGIAWTSGNHNVVPDLDSVLWGFYAPNGRNDGIYAWDRVPGLQNLMERHRREMDGEERLAVAHDLQRLLAQEMPAVKFPGVATIFHMYWPWMGNGGYFRVYGSQQVVANDTLPTIWYDEGKDTRSS